MEMRTKPKNELVTLDEQGQENYEFVDFYDKTGKLRSKQAILEEMGHFYDELSKSTPVKDFVPYLTAPEMNFEPSAVMEKYWFIGRKVFITSEITENLAQEVVDWIQFWNEEDTWNEVPKEKRQPIYVYIDTPGGLLTSTFLMVDTIKLSETPVYTVVTGTAYSGGFLVTLAGHKRFAYKHATFLFHEGSTGQIGDANKVLNGCEFYKNIQLANIKSMVLENSKITEALYTQHQKDDWYFDVEEAIHLGVIDAVATEVQGGIKENE